MEPQRGYISSQYGATEKELCNYTHKVLMTNNRRLLNEKLISTLSLMKNMGKLLAKEKKI